ncbi:EamA family transporter [Nocardioides pelophilus]|uniref:EamA family transporter n=1 Tax=Nocardioides pelophilus TaxID=2172019 RepID=UPI0028AF55D0|nr:EamA family transporter [Nocardioides pelophilus]
MRHHRSQPVLLVLALTAVAPALWGTTYFVTTEWLPEDRPLLAGTLRALPAGLLLVAVTRTVPRGAWWWRAGVLGVLNIGAFFALLFVAAYRLPGGVAATLGAVQPLVVVALSAVLLHERVSGRAVLAGVTGVLGVGLLVLRGDAHLDVLGVVAGLLGAASMAVGVVLTKRWGRPADVGVVAFTGWILSAGGLFLLPLTLVWEGLPGSVSGSETLALGYMTFVNTALTYYLWVRGIQLLPASRVAYLGLLSPVVATVVGLAAAGETLSGLQVVGLLLALGSLVAAQSRGGLGPRSVPPSRVARSRTVAPWRSRSSSWSSDRSRSGSTGPSSPSAADAPAPWSTRSS